MENELFDAGLLRYAQAFKAITAPLGDRAPRLRLVTVDYKNQDEEEAAQGAANALDGKVEQNLTTVSASHDTKETEEMQA